MKATNYAVLRLYEWMSPSLMKTFANEQNAKDYARIMHEEDGYEYVIMKALEEPSDEQ